MAITFAAKDAVVFRAAARMQPNAPLAEHGIAGEGSGDKRDGRWAVQGRAAERPMTRVSQFQRNSTGCPSLRIHALLALEGPLSESSGASLRQRGQTQPTTGTLNRLLQQDLGRPRPVPRAARAGVGDGGPHRPPFRFPDTPDDSVLRQIAAWIACPPVTMRKKPGRG